MATRRMLTALVVVAALVAVAVVATVVLGGGDDDEPVVEQPIGTVDVAKGMALLHPRGGPGDLVAVVTEDAASRRQTLVRASLDGDVWWRRPVEPVGTTVLHAGSGVVILVEEGDYVGLDSDDGSERWRVPAPPGPGLALVVGERLVVPADDGAIAGHDLETGEEVWALDDPENTTTFPPEVDVVDDETILVSRTSPDGEAEYVPVDVDDGTEGPAHAPECPRSRGGPERAEATDPVRIVPGTTDAVVVFGIGPQCAQRWSTTTGTPIWSTTTVPESDASGDGPLPPTAVVLDDAHLAFDGPDGVVVVDLADGAHRVLDPAGDGPGAPLFVVDGAVVGSRRTGDGATAGLAGWAADAAAVRWDGVVVEGADEGTRLVTGERTASAVAVAPGLAAAVVDEGVVRTVALDGSRGGVVGTVDPATGETTGSRFGLETDLAPGARDVPDGVWVEGDRAVVVVTGIPHLIDMASGEVVTSWT